MTAKILAHTLEKINRLIKNDGDLSNIDSYIADIKKEKYTIDSQLNLEQDRHLQQIHLVISNMQSANKNLQDLKYSVGKLDELRRDNLANNSNSEIFQAFDNAALVMKNINAIEEVYKSISTFDEKQKTILAILNQEITKDENQQLQLSSGDDLLVAHYELTKLRDLQDRFTVMANTSRVTETQNIVNKLSKKLDECTAKFDQLLDIIVDSTLDFVENGNFAFLIKVTKMIEYEEREDLKVRLWNHLIDKKTNNGNGAGVDNAVVQATKRLTKVKRSHERGYKGKFEELFRKSIEDKCNDVLSTNDLSILLGQDGAFYYQSISGYKTANDRCFPKEWDFFPKLLRWHQDSVRRFIDKQLESGEYSNDDLAQILDLDYENRSTLKQLYKMNNKESKEFRLVSEEKKKQLLNKALQENIKATSKWIDTAVEKGIAKFQSLQEEPSDRRDDRLSFQVAQDVMLILSSNTKSIRKIGDASILVQYFAFFANDIMRTYQESWVIALDKMTELWKISRDQLGGKNKSTVQVNENIGYLPRYITNLSNDCLILTDALERDFDTITQGLAEVHTHKLNELRQIATTHSIELGTYCLQKLSSLAVDDYGPLMSDMYTKSWYKSSTIIDGVLNIIDEEYLMPFIDFSYPELLVSLFDFITDDFLLNYINMLNYKRNFEKKVVAALERDGHKIMEVLGKHDEDGILENKMIIIDILIELISSEDESAFVEKWSVALSEVYDLPVDLMRIILECKKVEKSKITFIIGECEDMCKQSMTEHADKPASIFRKFHYSPMKK